MNNLFTILFNTLVDTMTQVYQLFPYSIFPVAVFVIAFLYKSFYLKNNLEVAPIYPEEIFQQKEYLLKLFRKYFLIKQINYIIYSAWFLINIYSNITNEEIPLFVVLLTIYTQILFIIFGNIRKDKEWRLVEQDYEYFWYQKILPHYHNLSSELRKMNIKNQQSILVKFVRESQKCYYKEKLKQKYYFASHDFTDLEKEFLKTYCKRH